MTETPLDQELRTRLQGCATYLLSATADGRGLTSEETQIRNTLTASGWAYLGHGRGRHVFRLPDDRTTTSLVVKLSRPSDRDGTCPQRSIAQNRTERRVWRRVSTQSPAGIRPEWLARVHTTGDGIMHDPIYADQTCPDSWLVMDYYPSLTACYPTRSTREYDGIARRFDTHMPDGHMDPALFPSNIGIRVSDPADAPPFPEVWEHPAEWCVYIDYGTSTWGDDQGAHREE